MDNFTTNLCAVTSAKTCLANSPTPEFASEIARPIHSGARASGNEVADKPNFSVDPPVPTTRALQNFEKVISRRIDTEAAKRKRERLDYYKIVNERQRQTLDRLRKWAEADKRPITDWILPSAFKCYGRPLLPDDKELIGLARHFCDFGQGSGT